MRRLMLAIALIALPAPIVRAAPEDARIVTQDEPLTREAVIAALQEAAIRAQNSDPRGVVNVLRPATASPAFATLSDAQRFAVAYMLGAALFDIEEWDEAYPLIRQASQFEQATGYTWNLRFWAAVRVRDYADAVDALERLARRWPAVLMRYREETITHVIQRVRELPDADGRELQVLQALRAARWRSSDPFVDPSYRARTLARLLLARGDVEEARRVTAEVSSTAVRAAMLVDRRFEAVFAADARAIDFAAGFEHDLAERRRLAAEHPDRLEGVLDVAFLLITLDRPEEALAIVDAAIARADSPIAEERRFADQADWANWMYDYRARALILLGRYDEAVEAMGRGARRVESGAENVSQTINLGELLLRVGRNEEALAALSELQEQYLSPYGWMNANYVRACANAELGRAEPASAILREMRRRAEDSRRVLIEAELCFGNVAEAARLYLAALEDSDDRMAVLLDAQNLLQPRTQTAFDTRIEARRAEMFARQDVRAAIERYGHVLTVPIRRSGL